MPHRTPRQAAVLLEGSRIAAVIAERAPTVDYTPAMLEEARGFYAPEDIAAVEERYGEFETFFVLTSFIQDYGIDKFASSLTRPSFTGMPAASTSGPSAPTPTSPR